MSTSVQPETGNTTQSATPPPNGAVNTSGAPSDANRAPDGRFLPSEWRYPTDYPVEYLRGRTADEGGRLLDQYYRESLSRQPRPQPSAPTVSQAPSYAAPDDTEWLTNPSLAFQKAAAAFGQQQLAPQIQQIMHNTATTNRALVQQRYADDFKRFGPEIDLYINQLDPQYRSVDNLEKVVKMVRAEHLDELTRERADAEINRRLSAAGASVRPDGTVGISPSLSANNLVDFNSTDLPEEYRQVLQAVNLKPREFEQFLRKYYGEEADLSKSAKDWFEKAKSGNVIQESRAGWRLERR